jgi:hypothetical protein
MQGQVSFMKRKRHLLTGTMGAVTSRVSLVVRGLVMHRSASIAHCLSAWSGALAVVIVAFAGTAAADPKGAQSSSQEPLQEVTVTAQKQIDKRTLDRVIIPRFVKSHGKPNSFSGQVTRWTRPDIICASTIGLEPAAADFVSHRITTLAASVGAPVAKQAHCLPNVEIIFTANPQEQVSYFAQHYRELLGWDAGPLHDRLTFSHQIRAWYSTATYTSGAGWTVDSDKPPIWISDPPVKINVQDAGSGGRITKTMRSGFTNVLVIADAKQVSKHSLRAIADYISMLVLTRTAVDGCSELPSIVDLFSADCAARTPPDSVTTADSAYLKALYTADLENNLNFEQNDLHDRMAREVLGR